MTRPTKPTEPIGPIEPIEPTEPTEPPRPATSTRHRLPLTGVSVVVPARNEERDLPACLDALASAQRHAQARCARGVILRTFVVLDRCTDSSEAIARRHGVDALPTCAGSVGEARRRGFAAAIAAHTADGGRPEGLWIASTDADTVVPEHWISSQILAADRGADALVGTVEPDARLPEEEREAWMRRHHLREGHPHVHGANLGVRASAYLRVGGFQALSVHEDVDLVERLRAQADFAVRATDVTRVVTSSRSEARAEGGFATYLTTMRREMTT